MYKVTARKTADGPVESEFEFTDAETLALLQVGIESHIAGTVTIEFIGRA
jgi:hypothetical protein